MGRRERSCASPSHFCIQKRSDRSDASKRRAPRQAWCERHVVGYLEGGLLSLSSHSAEVTSTERLSAPLAAERLAGPQPPVCVDVRSPSERTAKHIKGSIAMPLSRMQQEMKDLPADRPVLVHCAGGYRSSIAASLLQRSGFAHVSEIAGGITAWENAGLPVELG